MSKENNKNEIMLNNNTLAGFEACQRYAGMLSTSTLVPQQYRGKDKLADCMIALNIAQRLNADPLMVMQNLYLVHGQPAWSAKFLIATFNACGKFSSVKYRFTGEENTDAWGCVAYATEKATGDTIESPKITIGIAKAEGWYNKNGSKWRTMPQLMLMYRSASLLIRTHAPELSLGFYTDDEVQDTVHLVENNKGEFVQPKDLTIDDIATPLEVNPETGEVLEIPTAEEVDELKQQILNEQHEEQGTLV